MERRRRSVPGQAPPACGDHLYPQPLHRIRTLIGGSGERKTLRLVVRYAGACNLFGAEPAEIAHKVEVLRGHCEAEGRDPAQIRITAVSGADPVDDPDGFLQQMSAYAKLGVDQISVTPRGPDLPGWVSSACQLIPQLADL